MSAVPLTAVSLATLAWIADRIDSTWWHDVPHPQRQALRRRGLIADDGSHVRCNTHGRKHPGYVRETTKGAAALGQGRAA